MQRQWIFAMCVFLFSPTRGEEKYLCKGECNVTRLRCDCMESCLASKNCCSDYQETCQGKTPWVKQQCASQEQMKCPAGFEKPLVIIFSIDGFKEEYLYRDETPNIWKIANCGVHAPYLRSVYPTTTFPNHYTIATGLYPESHGIIDNNMYDYQHKEEFSLGSSNTFHPFWWGGEPIWVTTSNQGKKSASYFWPGSDVNITRYPDYYYKYNGSVDNEERMYQALEWLDLPPKDRPSFMTLYISSVDHAGHVYGPDAPQVDVELVEADHIVSILINGLKLRELENCVNIIILADHGMAPQSCDRLTYIDEYDVDMSVVNSYGGAFGRVGKSKDPNLWDQFNPEEIHKQIRCKQDEAHWQSFLKGNYFPKRFHYVNNARIEEVQIVMDDEWLVGGETGSLTFCDGGMHGFDNEYKSMQAVFAAHGPGFKRNLNLSEPIENIELYTLVTDLLSLTPAPNNGTPGALYHIMSQPPVLPQEVDGVDIALCFSPEDLIVANNLGCSYCPGLSEASANSRIHLTFEERESAQTYNILYDRPQVYLNIDNDDVLFCLLDQEDFIVAYNFRKNMPYYVSYTLENKERDLFKPTSCSRPDFRLNEYVQTSCSDYNNDQNVQLEFLYPPELSIGDSVHDGLINSNSIPMYKSATKVWGYMSRVLAGWSNSYGGVNVISGPIFDYDTNGVADTDTILLEMGKYVNNNKTSTSIPTHMFVIATRCSDSSINIHQCIESPDDIQILSFIIPNYEVEPCHLEMDSLFDWVPKTLSEHVARVKDIELLTGISFFPKWTQAVNVEAREKITRMKIRLPQFDDDWLIDFLNEIPPTAGSTGTKLGIWPNIAIMLIVETIMLFLYM